MTLYPGSIQAVTHDLAYSLWVLAAGQAIRTGEVARPGRQLGSTPEPFEAPQPLEKRLPDEQAHHALVT